MISAWRPFKAWVPVDIASYVAIGPPRGIPLKTFRTDIFCIEDVDDAPVYH